MLMRFSTFLFIGRNFPSRCDEPQPTIIKVTLKLIPSQQTNEKKRQKVVLDQPETGSYADQLMQWLPGAMTILRAQFPW